MINDRNYLKDVKAIPGRIFAACTCSCRFKQTKRKVIEQIIKL